MWDTQFLEIAPGISYISVTLLVQLRQRKVDGQRNDGCKWCGCQSLLLAKWCGDEGKAAQPVSMLQLQQSPGQGKRWLEKGHMAVVIKPQRDNHLPLFCWSTQTLCIVCQGNLIQDLDVLGVLWQPLVWGNAGDLWLLSHVKYSTLGSTEAYLSLHSSLRSGLGHPNIPGQMRVWIKLQLSESLCLSKIKLCILIRTVYIHC